LAEDTISKSDVNMQKKLRTLAALGFDHGPCTVEALELSGTGCVDASESIESIRELVGGRVTRSTPGDVEGVKGSDGGRVGRR
jgi:hypothetical protein